MSSPAADEQSLGPRWLPALLAVVSILPNPGAAVPGLSYYFRDFSLTYYPVLEFVAAEARAGRWPFWNPYLYEGSPVLPAFYPFELLHLLVPGPAAVSWLLTLHYPLAALAMYALARELGACRYGAFAAGAVYSTGGLALSSLNVQMFLQALAWAPLLILSFRRAATDAGRWTAGAALCLAISLSTLAVEFVGQTLALGIALALATRFDLRSAGRVATAVVLGVGLAGLPIGVMLGILSDSVRAEGMTAFDVLQKALHPLMLLQLLIPDLAGSIREPMRFWWGGRFFPHGSPYFMTLYLGPAALAAAAAGIHAPSRRIRLVLVGLAVLGVWYALGIWGGLAPLLAPAVRFFRFPVKAIFAAYLAAALWAGLGVTRLRSGNGWGVVAWVAALSAAAAALVAVVVSTRSEELAQWLAIAPFSQAAMKGMLVAEGGLTLLFALFALGLAWVVKRQSAPAGRGGLLLLLLVCADVWRGGFGFNRQIAPRFFDPLPELSRHAQGLGGGRLFSFGVDWGPSASAFRDARAPGTELFGFFVSRQLLTPFLNVLDRVEVAEGPDRHSLIPNPPLLKPWDYRNTQLEKILPVLRNAGVTRIMGLDALDHPAVRLRERFPAGPPGVFIHAYDLLETLPRSYVACRVVQAAGREAASVATSASGFDGRRDVALEEAGRATCTGGRASRRPLSSDLEEHEVEADGAGYLVMRDSWGRGWSATVDGHAAPVLRANGRHRAVAVPTGRHTVVLRYRAPGLFAGSIVCLVALLATLWLAATARGRSPA
jgi:hypothetical protein